MNQEKITKTEHIAMFCFGIISAFILSNIYSYYVECPLYDGGIIWNIMEWYYNFKSTETWFVFSNCISQTIVLIFILYIYIQLKEWRDKK